MTDEERDIITRFIQRVGGAPAALPGGSVPATTTLAPVDPAADQLIGDLFARYPEARYRLTQTAFVQEHALTAAQQQIAQLQAALQQARQAQIQQAQIQQPQPPQPSPWGAPAPQPAPTRGGLFGGLFGGGQSAPPPQYPPQYQQPQYQQPQYAPPPYAGGAPAGMFQHQGSGFLGSALTTAAGVAGGMVAGNALMNLFSGHHSGGGLFGGDQQQPQVVEMIEQPPGNAPWSNDPGYAAPDPYDAGGAPKDPGFDTGGGWQDAPAQDAPAQDAGWTDPGSDWTDSSGGSDDIQNV